jgi:hypothetical protein
MNDLIRPDPQHPQGGWALLQVALPPGSTTVLAIRDLSAEQWLAADGWQPGQTALGSFEVLAAGDVCLGPAIVDRVEPYAALEISVDGKKTRLTWPDTVAVSPAGLQAGGLQVTRRTAPASPLEGTFPRKDQTLPVEEAAPPPIEMPPELPTDDPETEKPGRRPLFLGLGFGALAVVAALLAYISFRNDDHPVAEPVLADCSTSGFAARRDLPYFEQIATATQCGGSAAPEDLLRILEAGVRAEEVDALVRMARLYDPGVPAEGLLVLSGRDPAIAAEYYARAAAAGAGDAATALSAVCALLEPENLLHGTARDQFCQ